MTSTSYASGIKNRIGQYHYADGALRRRTVSGIEYVIGIAGAYNAFGLIGSEHNGIFILDDTNKRVILDRHVPQCSGYNGPSTEQRAELEHLAELPAAAFLRFISTNPRSRLAA